MNTPQLSHLLASVMPQVYEDLGFEGKLLFIKATQKAKDFDDLSPSIKKYISWILEHDGDLKKSMVEKGWVTLQDGRHVFIDDSGQGGNAHRGGQAGAVAGAGANPAYSYTPAENLSPAERAVEEKQGKYLTDNNAKAIQDYKDANGNVLNTDLARELSPDYAASKDSRSQFAAAVHEPSSALVKQMYAQDLASPVGEGKMPLVLFTAGGTGAGKTSAIMDVPGVNEMAKNADIVYDTNMNTFGSAKAKIDQALASGRSVGLVYVNRDPIESLTLGALPRAMRTGRTVPLAEHVGTHVGALDTVKALSQMYANNPNVSIRVIDNTLGKGNAQSVPLDSLNNMSYNYDGLMQDANTALDNAYANGSISQSVYNGFKGTQ